MKLINFAGFNGYPLALYIWDNVKNPKAIVQLSHGMAEYMQRYDVFANFLNQNGYVVIGADHRAHGKTSGLEQLGKVPFGDCFEQSVTDMILVSKYAKDAYNLPIVLFAHSYGSFLAQRYIQKEKHLLSALILCGSAKQNGIDVALGRFIANIGYKLVGKDKDANLLKALSFGVYDSKFKKENKQFAWGTRDDTIRKEYLNNEYCGKVMSVGFYKWFFKGLKTIYKKSNLLEINKNLPIYIISGGDDPVSAQGKLVRQLLDMYKSLGVSNVDMKLYQHARHELLNELNYEEVYNDILNFVTQTING